MEFQKNNKDSDREAILGQVMAKNIQNLTKLTRILKPHVFKERQIQTVFKYRMSKLRLIQTEKNSMT